MPDEPDSSPATPLAPSTWRERIELLTGPSHNPWMVAAGVLVAVVVGAWAVWGGRSEPPELSLPMAGGPDDPAVTSTTVPVDVLVHAAGAVRAPGVYRLAAGARVADLLEAAGGAGEGADVDRLNLAAPLVDGQRIYVPRIGEDLPPEVVGSTIGGAGGGAGEAAPRIVDINGASQTELEELPGIGPTTARAILDERERRGRFRSVEELLEVRGIGPAKLEALRVHVRV